jgi:pimeloyl-ACP methyl ester carboxylesterase
MQGLARRHPRRYGTLDQAVARMREANPHLTAEQAHHLTVQGMNRNEDGTHTWKFDNYVRAASPYIFNMPDAREIWSQITCPTLLLRGTESWATDPEQGGRASAFRNYRAVNIEGAGHWVHRNLSD